MTRIESRQGQTVDMICHAFYGTTHSVTEAVYAANPGLAALGPLLPPGTAVDLPSLPRPSRTVALVQLWS